MIGHDVIKVLGSKYYQMEQLPYSTLVPGEVAHSDFCVSLLLVRKITLIIIFYLIVYFLTNCLKGYKLDGCFED